MEQIIEMLAPNEFFRLVAKYLAHDRTRVGVQAVGIHFPYPFFCILGYLLETLLRFPQVFFHLSAIGDVAVAAAHPPEGSRVIIDGSANMTDPARPSLLGDDAELQRLRRTVGPGSVRMTLPAMPIIRVNNGLQQRWRYPELIRCIASQLNTGRGNVEDFSVR